MPAPDCQWPLAFGVLHPILRPARRLRSVLRPPPPPQKAARNSFTHHQKTILVDAAPPARAPPNAHPHVARKRHVVAFVGGLDLCDGR